MHRARHSLSIFACFSDKTRELKCIFLGKEAIIYIQTEHRIYFFHCNLFLRKLEEKLARKARINTDVSISDCGHAPWASHNTPYNLINYIWPWYGQKKVYSHKLRLA